MTSSMEPVYGSVWHDPHDDEIVMVIHKGRPSGGEPRVEVVVLQPSTEEYDAGELATRFVHLHDWEPA